MELLIATGKNQCKKGYTQTSSIDYEEIFELVEKMNIVRISLSLVAYYKCELQLFVVKNEISHENLEDEVYMKIPSDLNSTRGANNVF